MQQEPTTLDPAPASANFAGLLGALITARTPKAGGWADSDGLQDDVATLSYERALQTHARYKPSAAEAWRGPCGSNSPVEVGTPDHGAASTPASEAEAGAASRAAEYPLAGNASARQSSLETNLETNLEQSRKRASVTVRMSKAESIQLQQRATEAGMTVSAYLRSCTFEVESLRAQVKQTLAELRAAQETRNKIPRPHSRWLRPFHRANPEEQ